MMTLSRGAGVFVAMRRAALLVVAACVAVVGLKAAPGPFPHARIGVANGCLVESIAFGDDLRDRFGSEVWYRVLQWGAKDDEEVVAGHAVVVFEYRGKLWCYDNNYGFKTLDVPLAQRDDLAVVAKPVTAPYVARITPRYPIYWNDFPQAPDAKPPVPSEDVDDQDVRDAGLVAARLATHRPVTLVEFTYPKDGETRRGAAAAFILSGRLCVYSAPIGTTPFRTKVLSVENTRQLFDALRRVHPGATNFKLR